MIPLKGKKILITAGPTWIPIDDVRVISNISSGELGIILAKKAASKGLRVDLFLGPVGPVATGKKIKVFRFKYFDELLRLARENLKSKKYDFILHAAAVSDYLIQRIPGKISSSAPELVLKLKKAPKIVEIIRALNPKAFLVSFKLEVGVTDAVLLKRALEAMKRAGANLVVANTFDKGSYKGFILGSKKVLSMSLSKKELADKLFKILNERSERS